MRSEVEEGADTPEGGASTEDDGPEAATPRRSRARSGDGAKPGASPRKAATPLARSARAGGRELPPHPFTPAPAPSAAEAEGAPPARAPAARPRSRARKPAAKPAE